MSRIEGSVIVNAPIEEVFELASDWKRWHEWFEGVSDFTAQGSITRGNGARYAYRARMMGIPAKVETEIHDFVENQGWRGIGTKGLPHQTRWIFEAQGQATKFTYILDYELPLPLLGPLLDRLLIKREWRRIVDESLKNLQERFATREGKMSEVDAGTNPTST